MSAVDVIGWAGTVSGTILGLPQVLRLVRTRRVDGLSLTAWRAMLVVNLIWTAHGISIGQVPQIVTSALSLCSTLPILYLMARELRRHLLPVLLPGLLAAGVLIAVDQLLGSAAFGTAAIIAAVVANAGQSIELVRSKRIIGVSVLYLILAVVNQGLWLSWAADITEEEWDRIITINLRSVFLCLKYEIPLMLQYGGGAIVNTSSGAGIKVFGRGAAYAAAKHGVVGLTKDAALDYAASNIRINAICPGIIDTEMMDRFTGGTPEERHRVIAQEPIGRMGRPDEIAATVVWLCSDAASFVTGHAMVADGGQTL